MSRTLHEAALTALTNKIESALVPIAVFAINGSAKSTKITSGLFAEVLKLNPERLVGVYDKHVTRAWLAEDLEYMGARLV